MSQAPKVEGGKKVSGTIEKVTELEISSSVPAMPSAPNLAPGAPRSAPSIPTAPSSNPGIAAAPESGRTLRPPPRPPSPSRPTMPPLSRMAPVAEKSTIHLGDADLEPLSALAGETAFSIRRGIVLGGRFRVKELIGAGAQCYVYSAEHTTLKSPVAIKCLQPDLVTPDLVERFAREAQALTAIRNAHVAAVLDVGRAPCGTPFIVMEFLQGRDVAALLETGTRLEPRQATEILLQTCEGLAAAHALGLVHQDIKPSNIFLSDEMGIVKAKVVDFGVARVAFAKTQSGRPKFTRSRLDDTVGGTPFYMPPEQYLDNSVIDPRSDIFSLGMVLYEMLRGTHAFDLEMSTRQPGEPVTIQHTGIDPVLVAVIERCLAQKREDRFESVAELAIALLPFAPSRSRSHADAAAALLRKAGHSVASRMPSSIPPPMIASMLPGASRAPTPIPAPAPAPSARWPIYVGGAALALAVGIGGLVMFTRAHSSSSPVTPAAALGNATPTTKEGQNAQRASSGPTLAIAIDPTVRPGLAVPSASSAAGVLPASSAVSLGAPVPRGAIARPATGAAGAKGAAAANGAAGASGVAGPIDPTKIELPMDTHSAAPSPAVPSASPIPSATAEDLGF
jgi:serine/threonine protein kinase